MPNTQRKVIVRVPDLAVSRNTGEVCEWDVAPDRRIEELEFEVTTLKNKLKDARKRLLDINGPRVAYR